MIINLPEEEKKKVLFFVVQIGKMKMAKQIITQRIKRNLSQKELANISKLNIKTIQLIENAQSNPNLYTLNKIAQGFKMKFSDFMDC